MFDEVQGPFFFLICLMAACWREGQGESTSQWDMVLPQPFSFMSYQDLGHVHTSNVIFRPLDLELELHHLGLIMWDRALNH